MGWDMIPRFAKQGWHQSAYRYGVYASYALFALAFTGIVSSAPRYLDVLEAALRYYVAIFLVVRFGPWVRTGGRMEEFDRRVAFSAGLFLLLTSTAVAVAKEYLGEAAESIGIAYMPYRTDGVRN